MDAEPQGFTPEDRRAAEEIERGLQLLVSEAEQKRTGYYERIQGAFIKFALFNNQRISRITQSSPFRLNRLTERPSTMVFAAPLSLGLDSSTLAAIAVRLLQQLIYARFTEHHQRKLFFILDEFSKLQLSAKEMEHFVSTSRSAGCVTVVILQSVDQIDPRARAELLDNLADRYILHGAGPATAMWFERTFHDRVATRATASEQRTSSSRHTAAGSGTSLTETTVPVLAAREIHNTGGLQYGAWLRLARYSSKPILADLERRN
jgi:type IV secretory pathway TraG/TraD family ATPase VirD4